MKTWVVANQKGGVGKTTTAVTLAGLLSSRGYKVLLVDLDPHGSLTSYFGDDPDSIGSSVYNLFQDNPLPTRSLIRETDFPGLYVLPASTALATLDRQLGAQHGKGLVLKNALAQLSDEFAYVILDCPPTMGVLLVNALAACEYLIIPVQSEFLAIKGLERMLHTITMINRARKDPIHYLIVPTLYDRRTRASPQSLQTMQENYSVDLWENVIPVDTQFREASRQGMPISYMNPRARGALAYGVLLDSLIGNDPSAPMAVSG